MFKIEVEPWKGRVHFANRDKKDYRLRLWKPNTAALTRLDILLPAKARVTVMIKRGDEFLYGVFRVKGDEASTGRGGGPIVN